ncbi:Transmembrane protein 199 [Chionoecetes opilio]|uniref:Transmembrane protein 199 n=1 Tax=Chionoecetes opilio TaxID=41210 RepID=A0A8J4Y1T7_CHIOP|nr:Transmembrane protein 199 [Chionoecetes opilio]
MTAMDDHISIIPSARFKQILFELKENEDTPRSIKEKLVSEEDSDKEIRLTTAEVEWCHTKIRECSKSERIHELLSESQIILPNYKPPARDPQLEARVQRLRFEQENREYRNMTRSIDATYQRENLGLGEIGKDMRTINQHIVSGMQYLLSVVGTFFAIFIAVGMATSDYGIRALAASISAVIVGLAELFFIIRDDIRNENKIKKDD